MENKKIIIAEREKKKQELWSKVTQAILEYTEEFDNLEIEIDIQETNEFLSRRLKRIALAQEIPGYFYICV